MGLGGISNSDTAGKPVLTHPAVRVRTATGKFQSSLVGSAGLKRTLSSPDVPRMAQEIARLRRRLRHAHVDSIMALVATVEARDPYTERHSAQVAIYAEHLARAAGLSVSDIEGVVIAALLHDIGKIAVPDAILLKPGPLTATEFERIKEHPVRGVEILRRVGFLERELPLVLHHHEWFDGRGYPAGLKGAGIPLGARILQAADCIDAMLSPRTYKRAMSVTETIGELIRWSGTQFDPQVARLGIAMLRSRLEEAMVIATVTDDTMTCFVNAMPWATPSLATPSLSTFDAFSASAASH